MASEKADPFPIHSMGKKGCASTYTAKDRILTDLNIFEHQLAYQAGAKTHFFEFLICPKTRLPILAVLIVTIVGCAEDPKPAPTVIKAQTTKAVTLTIGMKATEVIRQVGIPFDAPTLNAINQGANYTLQYQGRSYVFSKGVLQAVR